jgi:Lar family restriction alleviation protein
MNTEKAPELKPCPFCGGCKIGFAISKGSRGYPDQYDVCCDDCGASTDLFHEKIQAVEKWNTRAASTAAEAKCVKCGHNRFAGTCMEQVKFTDPTGKGVYVCGCHCEFPTTTATAAREAAEEIVHLLKPGRSQREKNVYVDTIVDMLSKHCFPVSGDVISRAEVLSILSERAALNRRLGVTGLEGGAYQSIKGTRADEDEHLATEIAELPAVQPVAAGGEAVRRALDDILQCFRNGATPDRSIIKAAEAALEAIDVKEEK